MQTEAGAYGWALNSSIASPLLATDWCWANDVSGVWDDRLGGIASWLDPGDAVGSPTDGDVALLVAPFTSAGGRAQIGENTVETNEFIRRQPGPFL